MVWPAGSSAKEEPDMTDERPLDPLREMMISALYGELSTGEMKRFEDALKNDTDLRAEWDELRGTRNFLSVAGNEEETAEFRFTLPVDVSRGDQNVEEVGRVVRGPWRRWFTAAAGFSAAAAIFTILLFSGLRVDRTAHGWFIGFSGAPENRAAIQASGAGGNKALLSQADFTLFARELVEATDQRLNRMEERRSGEQAVLVRGFLEALDTQQQEFSLHQQRNYEDLRARVELVAYGLASSQQRPRQILNPVEEN
jgi:hypothetical protein